MGSDGADAEARRPSLVRAAAATYGANLAVALLSLLNVLIIARALGPEGRGSVAFLVTVAILTAHLASVGVQEANANIGGSEAAFRPQLASNSLVLALAAGTLGAAAVAGLVAVFPAAGAGSDRHLLLLALAAIPLLLVKTYLSFLVQADYGFGATNLAWILGPATTASLNGLLAALGALSVGTAVGVWVGGQAIGAVVLVAYVQRHAGFGRPTASLARRSVAFGLKTHVGRFMAVGNYRVDQWILGAIAGPRELGLYSVAVAWAEACFYLSGVLVMVQRPDLVRATRERAAAFAARILRAALLLAVVLAASLAAAAPLLCRGVFGDEFSGATDDLRILALAAFGIVTLDLLGSALTAQRRPLLQSGAMAVAFVATLALDLLLIPAYGGVGAAVATSVAYTLGGAAAAVFFTRALGASPGDLVPRAQDVVWIWRTVRRRRLRGVARGSESS